MSTLSKQEKEIIDNDFKESSGDEVVMIKRLIIDVKKRKGLYPEVIKHGPNLYNSKNCIVEKTGLSEKSAGHLATILWFITKHEVEVARRLKNKVSEAIWMYEEFLCKHPDHRKLNGKSYSLRKGMGIGFFKHIYPGQLVGCGCMDRPIIPGIDKKPT